MATTDTTPSSGTATPGALQLRLVVHAEDLDAALAFYRDAMGLTPELDLTSPGTDARVVVLNAGRATLELVNTAQRDLIDHLEVGRSVSRDIRVALEVADAEAATASALAAGAQQVAPPTPTPWGSLNARLEAPAHLQLTLFQQIDPEDQPPHPLPARVGRSSRSRRSTRSMRSTQRAARSTPSSTTFTPNSNESPNA